MQFKVPQFIDIEDKVFGPLTFKQFAYLAGGAGFVYLSFKLLPLLISLVVAPVFGGLAVALAFFKYNEKPFIHTLESFIRFYSRSRLYLWRHSDPSKQVVPKAIEPSARGTLSESKLKTLSWSLDVIDPKK
jgi:hypothetical protein